MRGCCQGERNVRLRAALPDPPGCLDYILCSSCSPRHFDDFFLLSHPLVPPRFANRTWPHRLFALFFFRGADTAQSDRDVRTPGDTHTHTREFACSPMDPDHHKLSFFDLLLAHPLRERLLIQCPALLLFLYQHVVASRCAGVPITDPFARTGRHAPDAVSELLCLPSNDLIVTRAFEATEEAQQPARNEEDEQTASAAANQSANAAFWQALQRALVAAWTPAVNNSEEYRDAVRYLCSVDGTLHFLFPPEEENVSGGQPLKLTSLQNTLNTSKEFLRAATTCALAGSAASIASNRRFQALVSVMQYERLLPTDEAEETAASPTSAKAGKSSRQAAPSSNAAGEGDSTFRNVVTSEGVNFCMLSLQQQWWVLLNGALDRVVVKAQQSQVTSAVEVTKPHLWQLLAVLVMLDSTRLMFAFPDEQEDFVGFHCLMRLGEVGLLYGIRTATGKKAFIVSPHLAHALEWLATAPCCLTSMADFSAAADNEAALRREDTDTIITETNFRLYAYTQNDDLLNIIDMFADRERIQTADGDTDECISDVLVVYTVTRESFMRAVRKGISAAQILRFLSLKAHPSMLQHYGEDPHATSSTGENGGNRSASAGGSNISGQALAVPQSFCDRLFMWESECHRVTFQHHLVLLTNISPDQAEWLSQYLQDVGEPDAIVHSETGHVVLREDVYDRYIRGSVGEA